LENILLEYRVMVMSGRDLVCAQQTITAESSFQTRLSYILWNLQKEHKWNEIGKVLKVDL
jgi:hypothetical protein